jgi:hypothetical protein
MLTLEEKQTMDDEYFKHLKKDENNTGKLVKSLPSKL